MAMRGRWGWDKMEECLGVNGRQMFVRVDCNFEEWEQVLLVLCFIIKYVFWQTVYFKQRINKVVLYIQCAFVLQTVTRLHRRLQTGQDRNSPGQDRNGQGQTEIDMRKTDGQTGGQEDETARERKLNCCNWSDPRWFLAGLLVHVWYVDKLAWSKPTSVTVVSLNWLIFIFISTRSFCYVGF